MLFDNHWFRSTCKGCESSHQLHAARDEWMSALIIEIRICHSWYCIPLPEEWKESIIVPIHKKGDKTDCNNYRGISLLRTTYKIFSNILLSRLIPYAEEVIGDHQCGFRRNRSTADHIFCIRQS